MAVNVIYTKVLELLKKAGIDPQKFIGTIDPNKIKKLTTKTEKTATKPKLIDALNKDKATFGDALKIFENEAKYISQMNEMELTNFANNLQDYFTVGGKVKYTPSNVVTTEGTPVVGKKLETLSSRKGAAEADTTTLGGAMKGLGALIDEIKGISPKMRNQMDRDELAKFLQKMRGRKFTNEEIKWVKAEMDEWGIGSAKEKATGMQYGKKLGAKSKEEFEFVKEYIENVNTYSPKEFKEMFDVKKINMDLSDVIERKLEKHFKKKYKWDDTKKDGGLDEITYEKYEDDLYETGKEFSDYHRVYDSSAPFGESKYQSWTNNPKNWIDEASEKLESITGDGLNVEFYKKYTDDVLGKYPEPEKFQYGGPVIKGPDMGATAHGSGELLARSRMFQPGGQTTTSTGLNYLLGEDDATRIPFRYGKTAKKKKEDKKIPKFNMWDMYMPPEMTFREPVNFPYKSLEDIPPKVLEMLRKDPNFDLETFLTKVGWSDSDKTRIQEKLKDEVSAGVRKGEQDEAWGLYSPRSDMSFLNYQKFGESEPLGDGLLAIKSPSDADKVQTILHEMRHQKMREPWFWESSAIPKYVRATDHPHYSFQKYDDTEDPNKFVGGEELYVRFMDQHFGDVAEKGSLAGSDYKPYFDKILKDLWDPYAERYKEILKEEKRVKSKPYGLADGGIARLGFAGGKLVDASRRGFLKFLGGTAASIAALKSGLVKLMGGKNPEQVKKVIDEVVIAKETGAPDWFQPLVNKILREGKDANLTYGERQIGKTMDTPSGKVDVVYKLDTGDVELSFVGKNTAFGEQVDLVYKPGQVIEEGKYAGKKEGDQFIASETVPESHVTGGKDDVDWDIDIGSRETENVGELASDLSELKTFATGEKQTIKEIVEGIKKKKERVKMEEDPGQWLTDTYGDYDPYASGGLARLLGE